MYSTICLLHFTLAPFWKVSHMIRICVLWSERKRARDADTERYFVSGPWSCRDPYCLWEGHKAVGIHQKYLNLCSEDERRSYRFGTTWERVINDRIFIFGWTVPLTRNHHKYSHTIYSAVTLWASQVRIPTRGLFPIPPPLLRSVLS